MSRHLQILVASFPECFLPDHVTKLKHDCFYSGLPKWFKMMVVYLKASTNEQTYYDYLQVVQEAEKEEAMEPSHTRLWPVQASPKQIASSLYGSLKAVSHGPFCMGDAPGRREC